MVEEPGGANGAAPWHGGAGDAVGGSAGSIWARCGPTRRWCELGEVVDAGGAVGVPHRWIRGGRRPWWCHRRRLGPDLGPTGPDLGLRAGVNCCRAARDA